MDTATLYERLIRDLSTSENCLVLDSGYLDGLSGQLDVAKVKQIVCSYFPQGGLRVKIQSINPPTPAKIILDGKGETQPFSQMSIRVEIWT